MPYPNHENVRGNIAGGPNGPKPRVDFSPYLDSIDPECPQSPVGNQDGSTWDTETDHILSYFLGGDSIADGLSHDEAGFSSVHHSGANERSSLEDDIDRMHLPSTPAVQFYTHSHQRSSKSSLKSGYNEINGNTSTKNESSRGMNIDEHNNKTYASTFKSDDQVDENSQTMNTSVSAMVATLVAGGPLVQQHGHTFHNYFSNKNSTADGMHHYGSENPSPMSPAEMIGLANENLLLPIPSPSNTFSSKRNSSIASNKQGDQHGSHNNTGSIFTIDHQESKMLPPERLRDVFPDQNNMPATSFVELTKQDNLITNQPQSTSNMMFDSTCISMNNGDAVHHQDNMQHSSTFSMKHAAPLTTQQMIYAQQAEFASAILNRHHGLLSSSLAPQVESEEKRAKRLERNRESARKSRRKKKERLLTLGAQVNLLQSDIEIERRKHINAIVPVMNKYRLLDIQLLLNQLANRELNRDDESDRTCVFIQQSGPNSRLMRSVLDFQYTSLKQLALPSYLKFILWLSLLDDNFFTAGKEDYARKMSNCMTIPDTEKHLKSSATGSASKNVSSKQIGDELFNGIKEANSGIGKKKRNKQIDSCDRTNVTSDSSDGLRSWPLLCFELRFSVDQEERFLATHKQIKSNALVKVREEVGMKLDMMQNHRSQLVAALNTAESLSKAVGSLSHVISRREDQTLARILQTQQLLRFQTWLGIHGNRARCIRKRTNSKSQLVPDLTDNGICVEKQEVPVDSNVSKEASLQDICRRLHQVLHISQR